MPVPPPRTPAERLATILRCLSASVASRTGWALTLPLIALIVGRIRVINQRFARLAAGVAAGRSISRRRAAAPRRSGARRPRAPEPLPRTFGWLVPLIPEAIGFGAQLEHLLRDPEMAALLAAAPDAMRRSLRSLCWMLRVKPPPILASPRPAAPPAPAPAPEHRAPPPSPSRAPPSPPSTGPSPPRHGPGPPPLPA